MRVQPAYSVVYSESKGTDSEMFLRFGLGPEYRKLWLASAISNLGDGVTLVAAPLLAASLTRDPVLVAGATFASRLPWLLFSLHGGALVDRLDRRRLMGAVDASRALFVGILGLAVLSDWATIPWLYMILFLLGTADVLFQNASLAIVPSIVARDRLNKANSRLFAASILAKDFAGRPFGGFLFAAAAAAPFLLDAGSFAASAALIFALRGRYRFRKVTEGSKTTMLFEIGEGLRWLGNHRLLLTLAAMLGVTNLAFGAYQAILVLFAQDVLGLDAIGYGVLLTAGAAGALVGSLIADRLIALLGSGRALFAAVATQAAAFVGTALSGNPFAVGALFVFVGFAVVVWNVVTHSLRQALIPEDLLGRVGSVYRLLGLGGGALGALVGGFLAGQLDLSAPFWFAAIVMTVVALSSLFVTNNRTVSEAWGEQTSSRQEQ